MKKISLLVIIAIFAFSNVKAQSNLSFGIRAIPTFNWITTTDTISTIVYENDGTKLGFGFGPSLRYKLSDNFNVDVSGIFTWQKFGISIKNSSTFATDINIKEKYKVQFLQVPLNLNGQFDVADDFQALLNFGVGTGMKIKSGRLVDDASKPNATSSKEYDNRIKMLRAIDFYLTAGAGVVYNLEDNLHLSLTVQFNNGIIDGWRDGFDTFPETDKKAIARNLDIKHKNVALSIGFYIDL